MTRYSRPFRETAKRMEVHYWQRRAHTLADVPKGVVALFREGDLVDRVSQVAMFQQTARVLPRIPPVLEAFYSGVKPVHHVSAWHSNKHVET